MNEMIEELWEKYSDDYDIRKTEFKQAVQAACQAQRNACARVYERDYIERGGYNIHDYIVDAEIERCDYE